MPQKGDILIADNKTFVYTGYGVWEEKPSSDSKELKQDSIITELDKKADLVETQPVNLPDTEVVEGGERKIWIADNEQQELLYAMLVELKKVSLQMGILTDTILKDEDVDNT